MKRLTLVRHAKSSWDDMPNGDHGRALSKRGLKDAPMMGMRLRNQACVPDEVLCSTAVRARQTADLLLPEIDFTLSEVRLIDDIYESSVDDLLSSIMSAIPTSKHVMLIGHNPGLHLLCHRLLPKVIESMPSAAVSSFNLNLKNWEDITKTKPADVSLVFHDFPKNSPPQPPLDTPPV